MLNEDEFDVMQKNKHMQRDVMKRTEERVMKFQETKRKKVELLGQEN